jgi:hypothetical protein
MEPIPSPRGRICFNKIAQLIVLQALRGYPKSFP